MSELGRLNEGLKKVGESISGLSMQAKISSLEKELNDKQFHIDCLKEDLAKAQDNKFELPSEPIRVAEMLIYATRKRETNGFERAFNGIPDIIDYDIYSKSDLRQIAEHLLVYCNNSEDE